MDIGVFGFAQPNGVFAAIGLGSQDITLAEAPTSPQVDRFIEPFMDPFAASLLRRLSSGVLDPLTLVIFLRESPGAVHAFHYAREFQRRGLLPDSAPELFVLNLVAANDPAARAFNLSELDRLQDTLTTLGWSPDPTRHAGRSNTDMAATGVSGAPRLALLGAPLGNRALHDWLETTGQIVLNQQTLNQAHAAGGRDLEGALQMQADNPYAARQPKDIYIAALAKDFALHKVDRVIWQVDAHDDLWGWLAPQVKALCAARGLQFIDMGALPRWPKPNELAQLADRMTPS